MAGSPLHGLIRRLLIAALLCYPSLAIGDSPEGDYKPELGWQIRQSSLLCDSYSAIQEAEAAIRARDEKWLERTGCVVVRGGLRLVLIRAPYLKDTAAIWQARVYPKNTEEGLNVYLKEYSAVSFARRPKSRSAAQAEAAFQEMNKLNNRYVTKSMPHMITKDGDGYRLFIGPASYIALADWCFSANPDLLSGKSPKVECDHLGVPR
jgi:hypothetical protein